MAFKHSFMPNSEVYISVPTWANHHNIWRDANVGQKPYRYYKPETRGLDFDGFMEDIKVSRPWQSGFSCFMVETNRYEVEKARKVGRGGFASTFAKQTQHALIQTLSSLKLTCSYSHIDYVQAAPKGSVFLLHACAHNPTGE